MFLFLQFQLVIQYVFQFGVDHCHIVNTPSFLGNIRWNTGFTSSLALYIMFS